MESEINTPRFSVWSRKIWPWLVGSLIPVIGLAMFIMMTRAAPTTNSPFFFYYLKQVSDLMTGAALIPMLLLELLGVPGLVYEVAGFGFPSPLGLLVSAVGWMLIGKGFHILHRRYPRLFWLIIILAISGILVGGYAMTGKDRAFREVRKTGDIEVCSKLSDGEDWSYCVIDVAVASNNPSICEQVFDSWQSRCYYQLGIPDPTPVPGVKYEY